MPEMSEFMTGEKKGKSTNYLTQDETANDSRLGQLGLNNKRGRRGKNDSSLESQDESQKMQKFTPGRIRASRMGLSNMQEFPAKKDNYL